MLIERGHKDFVICRLKQRFNEIICTRFGVDVNLADKLRNAARIHGLTVIIEHGVASRILNRIAAQQIINDNLEHIVNCGKRGRNFFHIRISHAINKLFKHPGNINAVKIYKSAYNAIAYKSKIN